MKNIIVNFRKIFTTYGFCASAAFTLLLCFCSYIYTDPDTNNKYSVIQALISFDREYMLQKTELCFSSVTSTVMMGWIAYFVPVITGLCFVSSVCDRHESGVTRFELIRSSKFVFSLSDFIASVISGGFALTLGYAVFCGAAFFLFPSISEYETNMAMTIEYVYPSVFTQIGEMFFYGAVWSSPAIFLTSLIRNKYVVICLPFFLNYALSQTASRLISVATADLEHIDETLLRVVGILNPQALFNLHNSPDKLWILIHSGIMLILPLFAYIIIMIGRRDQSG